MILTPEQIMAALTGGDVSATSARGSIRSRLWTKGILYYTLAPELGRLALNTIQCNMYNTIQYNAYNIKQYNKHNTIQCNAMQ